MKYIPFLLIALFLSACQSSSDNAGSAIVSQPVVKAPVAMEQNKVYTLRKGDKLLKTTDDAVVKITKKAQVDETEVILLEGEAKIIFAS